MNDLPDRTPREAVVPASVTPRFFPQVVLVTLLVALSVSFTVAFRGLGRWLIREDPLAPADVLVVLSGGLPARAEEAARLFNMHYAPEVWVSRPPSPATELANMGISYAGEETYNREILIHAGVPSERIHIFSKMVVDTEEEVEEISHDLSEQRKSSVIIVTSPEHTRRVRALWNKLAGPDLQLIVHAAPGDQFDARHWWRKTQDAFAVVRELTGLLNVWAGLPVRPRGT